MGGVVISLCCPSRYRPHLIERMWLSAHAAAKHPHAVECIVYVDDDDPSDYEGTAKELPGLIIVRGPRCVLSEAWNRCLPHAMGSILMHAGDDLVFRSRHWDEAVRSRFDDSADKILLVHANDGAPSSSRLATHSFVHRRWVDTLGYLCPPYFVSDFNDVWLTEVADRLGRRVHLEHVLIEHMHPDWGKGEWDDCHAERKARHQADNPGALYAALGHRRDGDVAKLRAVMSL